MSEENFKSNSFLSLSKQLILNKIVEMTPVDKLPRVMEAFTKAIMSMHEGQAMEIYFRDNQIVPSLEDYR